jgi:hypothetical protein
MKNWIVYKNEYWYPCERYVLYLNIFNKGKYINQHGLVEEGILFESFEGYLNILEKS